MRWDFRYLIRRGGGLWPRSWNNEGCRPIRPPEVKPPQAPPPLCDKDEHWLPPKWQPPKNSADAWKK